MIILNNAKPIDGGITAPKGFKAAAVRAGIKESAPPDKLDLALIVGDVPCTAAALFTTNKVQAAPIILSKQHAANGTARAIIVNSGNANACAPNDTANALKMAESAANALGIDTQDVIVASTGVIGQELPIAKIEAAVAGLTDSLDSKGSEAASKAIMTTDTFAKEFAFEVEIGGVPVKVGGIAKGSGMINPNMATMLAFITTDAAISAEMLDKALRVNNDFNSVCVDGDTSTNDMVCVLASGLAGNAPISTEGEDYSCFCDALSNVTLNLARAIARDGEGATKLITCNVTQASSKEAADAIAKSVVSSSLVKAAMSAADANWGRILCAVGYAAGQFTVDNVQLTVASKKGMLTVCENGKGVPFCEETASEILGEEEISILVNMNETHEGSEGAALAFGCDLTAEYVRINADYRT
ncbi:MAG: bifunctional glutamate N-acetyltransferase/amino-acid acetyltransferase ArgJ [Oscillospiraceae bacterium]|nr:bifunctional glutamate N-acetyltransferase/amino-acid acetyltransferase ArgJ [Oscillospiraceae bacterium]